MVRRCRKTHTQELSIKSIIRDRRSYNLENKKPYPDLVIEVTVTSGGVNMLEGYRRMGVKEVWFWEVGTLAIYHLVEGVYQRGDQSELLKDLPLDLFCRYVTYYDQYEAVQEFRKVLRQQRQ